MEKKIICVQSTCCLLYTSDTNAALRESAWKMTEKWELGGIDCDEIEANSSLTLDGGFDFNSICNVRLALQSRQQGLGWRQIRFWRTWDDDRALLARADALLERTRLTARRDQAAADLPHGDQRKLEIAMLIALEPQVFMFDEPTAGMSVDDVPVVGSSNMNTCG